MLTTLDAIAHQITRRLAFLGVLGMLAVGVLTVLDVLILRTLLNTSIPGSNELLQTVFAVSLSSVLANGFAERGSLKVELLNRFLGPVGRLRIDVLGNTVLLIILGFIAWCCARQAVQTGFLDSYTTILRLPLSPFYWGITALFAVCVPVQLIVTLQAIRVLSVEQARSFAVILLASLAVTVLVCAAVYLAVDARLWGLGQNRILLAVVLFGALWVFVGLQIPVGAAMALTGILGTACVMGWNRSFLVLGSETIGLMTNAELALIPLFLMMGAFANVGGMSKDIYRLAHAAFGSRRGGLALATIAGCAGFGALTGSSIATAATIGSVSLPEMRARGYSSGFASGCVAAGATLGQLVPPSTIIVLYAILTEESIGKLYIAILAPAALSILLYFVAIILIVRLRPALAPGREVFDFQLLMRSLLASISVFAMFIIVIGGIYTGVFTVTEAASVGAVFTFIVAAFRGKLSGGALWDVSGETTRSVAMLYMLIIGALMMSFFLAVTGLPTALADGIGALPLAPIVVILLILCVYLLLGTVMDATAVMIITAGAIAPVVANLGYDPLWWGVIMVVVVELGMITPPFGINLFVLKGAQSDVTLPEIYRGVTPFVMADFIKLGLLIGFPAVVTWLPSLAATH